MRIRERSKEVLVIDDPIIKVERADLSILAERLPESKKGRVRLCAHPDVSDLLHEMLILLDKDTYVRPHRHLNKVESFHIIEGEVDVVIFDENGAVKELVQMGEYHSGKKFYYRLSQALYHTVLIRSETVLYHETTNGPFNKSDTLYAPWAPAEEGGQVEPFLKELHSKVSGYLHNAS